MPLALLVQFKRLANVYFLAAAICASIPQIAPTNPATSILPLIFVLVVSMIREGIEEFVWFWSDMEINRAPVEKLINGKVFEKTSTGKLKPGDIIKVKEDDAFPADIVLLKTANA